MALTAQYYTAMAAGYGAARALGALYADDAVCRPRHALARPVSLHIDKAPCKCVQASFASRPRVSAVHARSNACLKARILPQHGV